MDQKEISKSRASAAGVAWVIIVGVAAEYRRNLDSKGTVAAT